MQALQTEIQKLTQELSLAQAQPECRQPAIGEERQFAIALTDRKISALSVDEIKQLLKFIMVKIGLRSHNWPTDEEKFVLIEHIVKNFGGHTGGEIKLAFEMAIAGKLEAEVNCYENFTCLYFSQIMNAYRKWATQAIDFIPKPQSENLLEDKKELTDEEIESWITEFFADFKTVKMLLIPVTFYDYLTRKGLLDLSNKEKTALIENSAIPIREYFLNENSKDRKYQEQLNEFMIMKKAGCFTGQERIRITDIAKKVAVFNYFQNEAK